MAAATCGNTNATHNCPSSPTTFVLNASVVPGTMNYQPRKSKVPKCPLKVKSGLGLDVFDRSLCEKTLAQRVINLLSERELECFMLSSRGLSTKQIAKILFISYKTAATHRQRSRQKLGLTTTEALAILGWRVMYYMDNGLVLRKRPTKSCAKPIDNVDIPMG
jgi:DNA-binding CsgD family transcriptional regulator